MDELKMNHQKLSKVSCKKTVTPPPFLSKAKGVKPSSLFSLIWYPPPLLPTVLLDYLNYFSSKLLFIFWFKFRELSKYIGGWVHKKFCSLFHKYIVG